MLNPKHRSGPAAYDPAVRLAKQISDARQLLAQAGRGQLAVGDGSALRRAGGHAQDGL